MPTSTDPQSHNKDRNAGNITEAVLAINSNSDNERLTFILQRLVVKLHEFARETRLTTEEWMAGLLFLTATGQTCTNLRQVRILNTLGLYLELVGLD